MEACASGRGRQPLMIQQIEQRVHARENVLSARKASTMPIFILICVRVELRRSF